MAILPSLRARRKAAGVTLEELGEAVGCTGAAIGMWERGEAQPSADRLPRLAIALGCSIDDLFREAEEDRRENTSSAGRGPAPSPEGEGK